MSYKSIPEYLWERVEDDWYGFSVPETESMIKLLIEFDEEFSKLCPKYKIHQIKEKYWTLRIYVTASEPEDVLGEKEYNIIDKYERMGTAILQNYRINNDL